MSTAKTIELKDPKEALGEGWTASRRQLKKAGQEFRQAGREVWLAGLGAVALVGEGRRDLGERLVERGKELREKGKKVEAPAPVRRASERVKALGDDLEQRVERNVSATLRRFGVPCREEVQTLIQRVEKLTAKVEKMVAQS